MRASERLNRRVHHDFFPPLIAMLGVLLTSWTIRLALVCYALYVAMALTATGRSGHALPARSGPRGAGCFSCMWRVRFTFIITGVMRPPGERPRTRRSSFSAWPSATAFTSVICFW